MAPAGGVDAEKLVVAGQGADADAQLVTPLRQMVEVGHAVRQFHRVVVGQQMAQRPEADARGRSQRLGDE